MWATCKMMIERLLTSKGPSIAVSSEEMACKRRSKSFARSANLFRRVSLILSPGQRRVGGMLGGLTAEFLH